MYGLALEGGGVRGAFHMGVVKALLEEGYEFGAVAGTSIGALNGAVIAQGDFEKGYKLWESVDASLLFDIEEKLYRKLVDRHIDRELLLKLAARMGAIIENKGIDTGKMRQVIEGIVDENKLRSSSVDFGLVTVSITDLKPLELYKEDIPEGRLVDYLMASSSFPGFKLNPIEDKYYIDGGFYDNCPINLLARKGYKDIIAVRTFGMGRVQKVRCKDVRITNITPSEDLGRYLDFNRELIRRNLKMGYFDAMKSLKGLKGKKYYIKPTAEERVFDMLCSLPDNLVRELGKCMKCRDMPVKRMLFEKVIPGLAQLMGMKASSGYQDILIALLEIAADDRGVEKYKVYELDEFIGKIDCSKVLSFKKNKNRLSLKGSSTLNKKLSDALKRRNVLREAAGKVFEVLRCNESVGVSILSSAAYND